MSSAWLKTRKTSLDGMTLDDMDRLVNGILSTASIFPMSIGDKVGAEPDKWGGSVLGSDGSIYGIPRDAAKFLKYDPVLRQTTCVGPDLGAGQAKWREGVCANGCIFAVPDCASQVLCFDPVALTAVPIGASWGDGPRKWGGGALGKDGRIYFAPHHASRILRVDPQTKEVCLVGEDLGSKLAKWSGCVLGEDGLIYGIPYDSPRLFRLDTSTQTCTLVGNFVGYGDGKWKNGVLGPDGCIYGIPGNAMQVLRYDPRSEVATRLGEDLGDSENKWDGGVLAPNGCIYGIPCSASQILKFDPKTTTTSLVGHRMGTRGWCGGVTAGDGCIYGMPRDAEQVLQYDSRLKDLSIVGDDLGSMSSKWNGGVVAADGKVYGIPNCASQVLVFDPKTWVSSLIGPPDLVEGRMKWRDGCLGPDGCIYGIPMNASRLLKIVPKSGQVSLVGEDLKEGGGKFHGGVLGRDGCIYCIPRNSHRVLKFDPVTETTTPIGEDLGPMKEKWSSGVLAPDGCIYGIPSCATKVLRIDPKAQTATCVGQDLGCMASKWSGGVLAFDGCIYGVPFNASQILRFDPEYVSATCVGEDLGDAPHKWYGGELSKEGCMYCVPVDATKVLRFDPYRACTTLIGDELEGRAGKWCGAALGPDGKIFGIPGRASQVLRVYTDVAECAVLRCLDVLVGGKGGECPACSATGSGTRTSDCVVCSPELQYKSPLLAHGLSDRCSGMFRHIILQQWRVLCDATMGPHSLAANLQFAPNVVGLILDIECAKTRQAFLSLPGVREFMCRPESVGHWLEHRITQDTKKVAATVGYLNLLGELMEDKDSHELLLAMASLPRLLANIMKLPMSYTELFVNTSMVSKIIELKLEQPLAVFAQLTDILSLVGVTTTFLLFTWPGSGMDSGSAVHTVTAIVSMCIGIFLWVYEMCQLFAMRRLSPSLFKIRACNPETWTDCLMIIGVFAAGSKHLNGWEDVESPEYKTLVVITTFLLFYKLLILLTTLIVSVATFMTSLRFIAWNLMPFALVMLTAMFAFTHALRVIQPGAEEPTDAFGDMDEAFWSIIFVTMGDFGTAWFPKSTGGARVLFVLYMVLINIVMLNILIAVVCDCYAGIQGSARSFFNLRQLEYAAQLDAMNLTKVRPSLRHFVKLSKWFRKLIVAQEQDAGPESQEGAEESEARQREEVLELRIKALEKVSWVKVEASLDSSLAKMESRLVAQMLDVHNRAAFGI
ncbi:unnamed protein product [Polarella glacialis]|uniref:Ion transport domain-containing protein n=1 Tax=Polarella glacialis TaxID=89957 RepID=A0A813JQD6_POLGL|nr:unnamed protein product [Polarella glacialis]